MSQLNHQSGREAKYTPGSDESAMPSHRNVKYIDLGGLSHVPCSKSMANRCSPGDMGVRGGVSQLDRGRQRGFPWVEPAAARTWEGMKLA